MPDLPAKVRRAALEALGRDSLANLTTKFNLAVQDRRAAAAHVDALMRSRTVEFPALLGELQRDDLKAICEAIGLDPSGREKEGLVQRILADPGAAPAPGNGASAASVLGGQVKSGQRWTGQNRPTARTQDQFASIPRSPRPATSDGCASSWART